MSLCPTVPAAKWAVESDSPLRIIVAWDGVNTEALELASWLGRTVPVVVQLVAPAPSTWKKPVPTGGKKFKKWLKHESDAYASIAHEALKKHLPRKQWGQEAARMVASTSESASLLKASRDFNADLVIIGSKRKKSNGSILVSSVADSLIEMSQLPLTLAPKDLKVSKKGVTRVNYIFLGNAKDRNADGLQSAAALALRMGVPIRLIAMSAESIYAPDFSAHVETPNESAQWYETSLGFLDLARDRVLDVATAMAPGRLADLHVEVEVSAHDGWKQTANSVKWKKGDLVCLAPQLQSPAKRVITGSQTVDFLRHASVPALIFPRSDT